MSANTPINSNLHKDKIVYIYIRIKNLRPDKEK